MASPVNNITEQAQSSSPLMDPLSAAPLPLPPLMPVTSFGQSMAPLSAAPLPLPPSLVLVQSETRLPSEVTTVQVSIGNGQSYDTNRPLNKGTTLQVNCLYRKFPGLLQFLKTGMTPNPKWEFMSRIFNSRTEQPCIREKLYIRFDFLCSPCNMEGTTFETHETNEAIIEAIRFFSVAKYENIKYIFAFGDHSLGALLTCWPKDLPALPIERAPFSTGGPYTMTAKLTDLEESGIPCVVFLAKMLEADENGNVSFAFLNMGNTIVIQEVENYTGPCSFKICALGEPANQKSIKKLLAIVTVEFGEVRIEVAATHWCNLTMINSVINRDRLLAGYAQVYGREKSDQLAAQFDSTPACELQQAMSRAVSEAATPCAPSCDVPPGPYAPVGSWSGIMPPDVQCQPGPCVPSYDSDDD